MTVIPFTGGKPSVVVSLRDVGKTFSDGTVALDGFDLDVRRGEVLSLVGPSGCGKSTILRVIAGLSAASSGTVVWPVEEPASVACVFQEPTLMPWASVFDNVWLPLRLAGLTRRAARERVMAALAAVGLEAVAGSFPRALSGGVKMRVSIARALVTRPRLLLMDEPFAALDEITRHRLNDDLLTLQAEFFSTIVFVTHSVYEAAYLSHRVAVMAPFPGRVVAEYEIGAGQRDGRYRASRAYRETCQDISATLARVVNALPPQASHG